MATTLRKDAASDTNVFHFVLAHQKTDARRGCSRVRELARLWWRVHQKASQPQTAA